MLILTDCPGKLPEIVSDPSAWTRRRRDDLLEIDRVVWGSLGRTDDVWAAETGQLGPLAFWSRLVVVSHSPFSQFDRLRELLEAGGPMPGPLATLALTGENFHGHRGRSWVAAPGNLHLCAAFPECGLPARHGLALTMLPAVSVVETLRSATGGGVRARVKWINDILVDGAKLAGVLAATQSLDDRLALAVLGIGVNLAVTPALPRTPFVPATTNLAAHARGLGVDKMCLAMLAELAAQYSRLQEFGPQPLIAAYRAASSVIGRRVCVWDEGLDERAPLDTWPAPAACGTVRGIADDLALILEGVIDPVAKGRLAFAEHCGNCAGI
jgi:BirA family biotin operon repressor/biotin-[acetyl-CoA-carboxylase] ligase